MTINDLFKKDIRRNIQGVIKIGQDTQDIIREELDEYVVTKELNRHFDRFFDNYRKGTGSRTDKIGVWISGFFGSGKSHFLKILSYLLSNNTYDGSKAISYFEDKIADSRILADMKVAADTSADVILFNIDAKSDADSKTNKDAIVKVFMKVFNEMQGFCGSMPWIADLERQMVRDGVYESFKARFAELSSLDWTSSREDFYFEEDSIIRALADTTKMSEEAARSWYNKSEANYSLDVTQFATKVREYIERKSKELGKKHFVIFLCDEIGQYIGSNDNLMLNLQTVVENLGTECGGRAWVIATSQQDIDSITKVNRDNFSKIIGRFDTRLSLSSSNVDEVIKKRLLAKTDTAAEKLRLLYAEKNAIIKNLITFSHDTTEKKLYRSEQEFVDVYPFIPYQFNLLQAVFTGIRTHGASGKHLSEGERSLLNAFQEAATQFGTCDDGILIPFDAFFSTIETFLDHNIMIVIRNAEKNDNLIPEHDIPVLKCLFMIKYIKDVLPSNVENITTIMLRSIDEDKVSTQKRIDASLRRLEAEKLIIKNGPEYIFLTNEEQDINREIREIKIDPSEIIDKAGDEIVSVLFGLNKKYRYSDRYDFAFNVMVDDRARGNQREEIGVRIITPLFLQRSEHELKFISGRENNMVVALPSDMAFIDEMEQALQIDAFIRKTSAKISIDVVEDIKTTKVREAKQRRDRCRDLIIESLRKADIYVDSLKLDIKEKSPSDRITDAFKALVECTYTKLSYITKPFFNTDDLRKILVADNTLSLDGVLDVPNQLALEEINDVVTKKSYQNMSTTMKTLMEIFGKIPYGWCDYDIAGIVLTLFKNQELRLELGGESLSAADTTVIDYVTKRDYVDRLLVKVRVKVTPALLQNAKSLAKELFTVSDMPSDEDSIKDKFCKLIEAELYQRDGSIKDLLSEYQRGKYPGKAVLDKGKKLFEDVLKIKDIKGFFDYLNAEKDTFLDYEEDVADVRKFFKNQREIFDRAIKMLNIYEGNRSYVLDPETVRLVESIDRIVGLGSPYSEIHKLPDLIDSFIKRFGDLLQAECEPIQKDIEADLVVVRSEMTKRNLADTFSHRVSKEFDGLFDRLSRANNIYEAIAMRTESDRLKLRFIEDFIAEENRLKALDAQSNDDAPATPAVKVKTISVKMLFSGTSQVSSSEDVDRLLTQLKDKLMSQLDENTTIKIV